MTSTVQTVLGPLPVEQLGFTLMHEHLRVSCPGWEVDTTLKFDREAETAKVGARLIPLKQAGVSSMVDPCPMELARDPAFMAALSRQTGVNIICSTGLYLEHGLDFGDTEVFGFPPYFRLLNEAQIQRIYTTELTEGIGPERIKPGVIKCATGPHRIGKHEERALRAGARTALSLDVRITTHTTMGTMGHEQLDIFLSEGVKPHHVVIGHCDWKHHPDHCDWRPDPGYHRALLERGCYIGFDTIGVEFTCPDAVRASEIAGLVAAGYEKQIILSHDHVGCFLFRDDDMHPFYRQLTTEVTPARRYTYLVEEFIPKLLREGVSESAIRTMTVENPRRYFAGESLQAPSG